MIVHSSGFSIIIRAVASVLLILWAATVAIYSQTAFPPANWDQTAQTRAVRPLPEWQASSLDAAISPEAVYKQDTWDVFPFSPMMTHAEEDNTHPADKTIPPSDGKTVYSIPA